MNILAVDTAGKTAGVALLQDDRLLYEVYLDGGMTHSETLMPMIDTCLKMCGLTCADIDLYAVNAGPGSFTGLRIGLAAVKGLAFPRETLCAPVSTLEALAAAHTGEGTVLCALDARRAQVYSAAFDLATHARLLDDDARDVSIWLIIFALIGARLYYVIFFWEQGGYAEHPLQIFNLRQGGLAVYGSIIGGIITLIVYCRIKKKKLLRMMDTAAYGMIIGQIIGRWAASGSIL